MRKILRQVPVWMLVTAVLLFSLALPGCEAARSISENPLSKADPTGRAAPPAEQLVPEAASSPQPSPLAAGGTALESEMITITIIFDNYPYRAGLRNSWGFAALVTYLDHQVLFDTGSSGSQLLDNMDALGIQPAEIQAVVLSHEHDDHIGGLQSLLSAGADPVIYIPPSFSAGFKDRYSSQARLIESQPGLQIAERIYTTGELQGPPPEQALVIDTTRGLVVITGCAHPGVDTMVLEAKRQFQEDVYLVAGGFHLGSEGDARINAIIKEFQRLGVTYAAPSHCTGDHAIGMFRNAFGDDFIRIGAGAVITIEN